MQDTRKILKRYWGYDHFRPRQEDIINTVLTKKDCLALLPTGGGKSLCFQVPAMASEGLCLVISPLIALMKDQVENLRKRGITAFAVHSGMNWYEVKNVLQVAGNSNCKFLYVSPERLETGVFKEFLPSLNVRLIAVDEAHCISQWGYDFRPSYLRIAELRGELEGVPVIALTASATPVVQKDICDKLLFSEQNVLRQSFERPNLSYSVFNVPSKINKIIEVLNKVDGSAIVYCRSRKRAREFSDLLNMNRIAADYYHAGVSQAERNLRQEDWIHNRTRAIVCTNAFGMGIDKPDVRLVIHADIPDCLENYYQEAGRAGRDGKRSYAVLLYTDAELEELSRSVDKQFPSTEKIRTVYKCLMNYLQVPSGSGEGNYYEFDLLSFIKTFRLNTNEVMSSFRVLGQENLLYFNEQVYVPARIHVLASRESMRDVEKTDKEADRMLKILLRSYEGILDQQTAISEKTLAKLSKLEVTAVIELLKRMHDSRLIDYSPQKDKPQVFLVENRTTSEDLFIDQKKYAARKTQFVERTQKMIDFVRSNSACRSVIIGNYFGDSAIKNCGICDNCIASKKKPLSAKEVETIQQSVLSILSAAPATMQQIISHITTHPKEKTTAVLKFMQSEDQIGTDERGGIFIK